MGGASKMMATVTFQFDRRRAGLVSAAALAAAGFLVPASAQVRTAPMGGGWNVPFAPVSPSVLGGIQNLLTTPAGLKLTADLPSFEAVRALSPNSDADLRAVGALGAYLPADFPARLAAALPRASKNPEELAALARTLSGAYQAAVPEVLKTVGSRATQVVGAVADGKIDGRELVVAANQLERYNFYGPAVQAKSGLVRRLASQQIMEDAQKIAANFLRGQRSSDAGPDRSAGRESAGTYNPGGQKKIPDAWKIHAYAKPAAAPPRAEPPPAEPKAKPMSSDLYERIGAKPGMTPAQLETAYRQTSELYRPERYIDRDQKSIIALTMAFLRIQDAHDVLSDPKKRAEYDRGGAARKVAPSPNPLSDDFYERIGATKDMSAAKLKSAYRKAAAAYHPDKSRTSDDAMVKAMTKAFQNIGEAYETLGDPQKRAAYDRKPARR